MRRHLVLLAHYFLQYSKTRLAYRGDFLLSVITMTAASLTGIVTVYIIFGRLPRLFGWSFNEILFLYGFTLLPLSLFNTISINLYYFSEQYLVQGKFDRVLLRPLDSLFQILFEQFRLEALGDGILGLAVVLACAARLDLRLGPLEWLVLAGATLCGATIYVSVFVMLTCISFWMEDRVGVIPPVYNMLAFGRYPLDIYNSFIRFVLSWVVPFGFASFYPTAALLKQDLYGRFLYVVPIVTVAFLSLAILVWRRGVRNYSSTGS